MIIQFGAGVTLLSFGVPGGGGATSTGTRAPHRRAPAMVAATVLACIRQGQSRCRAHLPFHRALRRAEQLFPWSWACPSVADRLAWLVP